MTDCIHMTREMAEACPICRAKIDVEEVSAELAKTFSEALAKTITLTDTPDMIPRAEADARVTAALREAAEVCNKLSDDCGNWETGEAWAFGEAGYHILALIPDSGAAFDRAIADAVQAEREAVCRIIHDAITAGTISPRGGVLLQDAICARTEGEG